MIFYMFCFTRIAHLKVLFSSGIILCINVHRPAHDSTLVPLILGVLLYGYNFIIISVIKLSTSGIGVLLKLKGLL